jgi:FkbM family methyltransferase
MHWLDHPVVRQLPLSYRLWARYLRLGPKRRSGGTFAGSALFRSLQALARIRPPTSDGLLTLRDPAAPFALTIDLLDFEAFNHTLDLWLRGCEESRLLGALFSPGDVFVDVGANLGIFSLQAAALGGPRAKVYSFEPQPRAAVALRLSAVANSMHTISVVEMVVGAHDGVVPFFVPRTGSGVGSLSAGHASQGSGATQLDRTSTSLDAFVASRAFDRLDVMKIDVEGFEADVLEGARQTLRRFSPVIWFETNPAALEAAGRGQDTCLALLKSCGYDAFYDVATLWSGAPKKIDGDVAALTNVVAVPASRVESFWSSIKRRSVDDLS